MSAPFLRRKHDIFQKHHLFVPADDWNVLMPDIIDVCNSLNKGYFVIEVFNWDPLNRIIASHAVISLRQGNFCYYVVESVGCLAQLNIERIRYINVFTVSEFDNLSQDIIQLKSQSPFCFADDNYMEVFEFRIDPRAYPPCVISAWVQ